ncbi:MFS transporter [Microbacterium sp. NPDC097977]|uniref:MFS transporter n=1 Tax=Microbacterium sp. NPDC097977 TaxID=3155686 RepID=UPI00332528D9
MPRERSNRPERRTVLLLAAVNLVGLGSLTTPVMAGIPLKIDALFSADQRAGALALVLAIGGVSALIANPVFGALSDRTRGRFGRRRPWMLAGALAGIIGILALSAAESFAAIIAAWVCVQVAFNATLAAAAALLADVVPEDRRASASGIFTAAAFLGVLPPLVLTALLPRQVDLIALVMPALAIAVVGAALTIRESAAGDRARVDLRAALSPTFVALWLQRLGMQSALGLTTAFTLYMVIDRMTGDAVGATPVAMIATLLGGAGIVVGASVGGAWASRRGRYLPFLVAGALGLAGGATIRAFADAPVALWTATTLGGLAVGVYLAVNLALAMRVIPQGRGGAYLGVLNAAETIPQIFGPMVAAMLLHMGAGDPISGASDDYMLLYLTGAAVAVLSMAAIPALRRAARGGSARGDSDLGDSDRDGSDLGDSGAPDAAPSDNANEGATSSRR